MDNHQTPKKMKRVGDLFDKYRTKFVAPQASVEKVCVQAIKDVAGFELSTEQINYTTSTQTITLQVPSVVKSELKFHHPEILKKIKTKLGSKNSPQTIL